MKHLKAPAATTLLIASIMTVATYAYIRGDVQEYLRWGRGPYVESCMENWLTTQQFLSSYGTMLVIGILPAILIGTGA